MKSFYVCLVSIALYLFCSVALYHKAVRHCDNDSYGYDRIAYHFTIHNRLADPLKLDSAPIQPVGYPFFLGLLYKLFGHTIISVVILQVVLGIICILLTGLIARILFGDGVASLVVLLAAFNVGLLTYPQFILAEMIVLVWLLLFWYCFLLCYESPGARFYYVLAGLCIGISVLIKSTALLFIPVVGLFFLINKQIKSAFIFLISAYAPILLYMTYNYLQWGYFAIAPLTSLNLYQVFLSKVIAKVTYAPIQEITKEQLAFTGKHSFDESGWQPARTLFFSYITEYPGTCIVVWMQNVLKSTIGLFSTQLKLLLEPTLHGGDCSFFAMQGSYGEKIIAYIHYGTDSLWLKTIAWLEALWLCLRWVVVGIGIVVLWQKKRYGVAVLLCFYGVQCVLITGFDGCARYRLMVEPIVLIFAAAGIYYLYKKVRLKRV